MNDIIERVAELERRISRIERSKIVRVCMYCRRLINHDGSTGEEYKEDDGLPSHGVCLACKPLFKKDMMA